MPTGSAHRVSSGRSRRSPCLLDCARSGESLRPFGTKCITGHVAVFGLDPIAGTVAAQFRVKLKVLSTALLAAGQDALDW